MGPKSYGAPALDHTRFTETYPRRRVMVKARTTIAQGTAAMGTILLAAGFALAADPPLGKWNTLDDKTGKVVSEVQLYDQGGKAELWTEGNDTLKVRGNLGPFYKTQTWTKAK
jgi:uncharacterized protein (DUF2147 family)